MVFCSQGFLGSDHGFNSVVHVLDKLNFVSSESSQVGDVEDAVVCFGVLSVDTSDLHVVLIGDGLMEVLVGHQLWKMNVHGSSETSSEVGWAVGDVTKMVVVGELGFLFNLGRGDGKSLEDFEDVGSSLHGDDSELIFFVDPHKESLVVVVEDSSSLWPVSLETAGFEVLVSSLEKEVIGDELFLLIGGHLGERVVLSGEFSFEFSESGGDESFDLESLFSGDGGSEWESGKVSCDSDSSGVDHLVLVSWECWAFQSVVVHRDEVLVGLAMAVVLLDQLVEERGESVVGVVGSSVDADAGVGPLGTREDGLFE
mgnify:FL=1